MPTRARALSAVGPDAIELATTPVQQWSQHERCGVLCASDTGVECRSRAQDWLHHALVPAATSCGSGVVTAPDTTGSDAAAAPNVGEVLMRPKLLDKLAPRTTPEWHAGDAMFRAAHDVGSVDAAEPSPQEPLAQVKTSCCRSVGFPSSGASDSLFKTAQLADHQADTADCCMLASWPV